MYQPLAANISQVSEGTVASGITPTVLTNTTTIGQLMASCPYQKFGYIRQSLSVN